jgi:hypothetical protein
MQVEVRHVDPDFARQLLTSNTHNRPLSLARVRELAEQMRRGEWRANGDSVRISRTNRLLDGQHRLHAIVASETSHDLVVVCDLEDEVFDTIDIGAKRKTSELVALRGHKNAAALSTVTRRFLTWQTTGHPLSAAPEKRPSNAQILAEAGRNTLLHRATSFAVGASWLCRNLSPSDTGFCYAAFSTVDEDAALTFLRMMEAPGEATPSVVLLLRDQLMETRASTRRMTATHRIALTFKTWRLWRTNKSVKFLRIRTEGDSQEQNLFKVS